jgi:hypothetical protein
MERRTRTRRPKTPSPQAKRAKEIWAENVAALIAQRYPLTKYRVVTEQEKALAKDADISPSSVQRASDPTSNFGIGLDQLAAIAGALNASLCDLLRNGYAASLQSGRLHAVDQDELQRASDRSAPK